MRIGALSCEMDKSLRMLRSGQFQNGPGTDFADLMLTTDHYL